MMEGIAHPGGPKPKWGERLVILQPDLFIFEGVRFAELPRNVPRQRIDLPALLYVLDDDGHIRFLA